jgi:hypothetical protein
MALMLLKYIPRADEIPCIRMNRRQNEHGLTTSEIVIAPSASGERIETASPHADRLRARSRSSRV